MYRRRRPQRRRRGAYVEELRALRGPLRDRRRRRLAASGRVTTVDGRLRRVVGVAWGGGRAGGGGKGGGGRKKAEPTPMCVTRVPFAADEAHGHTRGGGFISINFQWPVFVIENQIQVPIAIEIRLR